jgi:hypothetical protein
MLDVDVVDGVFVVVVGKTTTMRMSNDAQMIQMMHIATIDTDATMALKSPAPCL